jgi:membrane associated rhomboid family serine protease
MHGPFVPGRCQRLKWWLRDVRAARFSWAAAAVVLLVESCLSGMGGHLNPGLHDIYESLGLSRAGIARGQVWQLVTHGCLHGGWLHVSLNALCLIAAGARVERIAGVRRAATLFLGGIFSGGVAFLLFPSEVLLVGASGGIFALVLWLTTVSPQSRMAFIPLSARNLGRGLLLASGLLALFAPWMDAGGIMVSHACHFGGALCGWGVARWSLRPPPTLEQLKRQRARREKSDGP